MVYTGRVEAGGGVQVRQLAHAVISECAVGDFGNNAYLLRCRATGAGLLIDAAAEPERLLRLVDDAAQSTPTPTLMVLTTHRHADHWQALAELVAGTGASTLSGAADAAGIPVATGRTLVDGDTVAVGRLTLTVIGLRGHTPGSIALHYQDDAGTGHLFTGDSLFPGGIGKTHTSADFVSLMNDVEHRLFDVYGDDTWFYPGHGDDSSLGAERSQLTEWRARGW